VKGFSCNEENLEPYPLKSPEERMTRGKGQRPIRKQTCSRRGPRRRRRGRNSNNSHRAVFAEALARAVGGK